MVRVLLSVIIILLLVGFVGVAYFAYTDVPPPTGKIERVIPESRLPK